MLGILQNTVIWIQEKEKELIMAKRELGPPALVLVAKLPPVLYLGTLPSVPEQDHNYYVNIGT